MAKIIVEQVQGGSGGTALTVPTAAATVNNQAVVGSTAGVLSHSPIALPAAASGAANRPLVGATTGATTFSPIAMPASDGTANQYLQTNGSGQLAFSTVASGSVPEDNLLSIGMVMSSSARQNVYSTGEWSSSGPNSTYYNNLQDASARTQAWNMLMGDGYPTGTSQHFYVNDDGDTFHREMIFAHNQRLGHSYRDMYYHDNASTGNDYAGVTFSCIPIRNSAASGTTTVSVKTYASVGSSTYGGRGVMYYTPTYSGGTNYANASGGAWTVLNSYGSNNDQYGYTASVPVAAGTTVLLFMSSAHRYHTTYRYKDTHNYYDLQSAFTSSNNIKCDQKILHALWTGRQTSHTYNTSNPYEIYTTCASLYGDR